MAKSILIVDDEASVTLALESFFQSRGYVVMRAFYGDQALAAIEKERPTLLILDLQMPGVDGIAVLEKVRHSYPEIKTLVATGFSHDYQKELARLQPDAVRVKPVSLEDLSSAVEELLNEKAPSEPPRKKHVSAPEKIRILFITGDEKLYREYVQPHFEVAGRDSIYTVACAPDPKEAFRLLEEFQPHLVVLDVTRMPVGVEAGKLAADLARAPHAPAEVILHTILPLPARGIGSLTYQFDQLDQRIEQVAQRHRLLPASHGGAG